MGSSAKKAFTLLEAMVSLLIVGILLAIAIPSIGSQIKSYQVKEDIMMVEQILKEARNLAITKSRTVYADFSEASVNHGESGGLIKVSQINGRILTETALGKNVFFNQGSSTINGRRVIFNFHGQPVDSGGLTSGFTRSNNKITISYYNSRGVVKASKSLTVSPVTGTIERN